MYDMFNLCKGHIETLFVSELYDNELNSFKIF